MRSLTSYAAPLFFAVTLLCCAPRAQAQAPAEAFASSVAYTSPGTGGGPSNETPRAAKPGEMLVLTGTITNAAGVLPGAVVILTGTRQMAVTNANGEFSFTVPATAGALPARVTYAGYADEPLMLNAAAGASSTASLTNVRVVVVARRQQLKHYLKTARKQVRRQLRQVRG